MSNPTKVKASASEIRPLVQDAEKNVDNVSSWSCAGAYMPFYPDAGKNFVLSPEESVEIIFKEKASPSTIPNMDNKYESLKKALEEPTQPAKPLIQRVPHMLRKHKNSDKYYEPKVMAIGPLHHGESHLQLGEQHKLRLAALFVKNSGLDTDVFCSKIWTEIQGLKKCFDQEEIRSFTDEKLGWMLFVDGCAVLQLIKCVKDKTLEELKIKFNQLAIIIWHDLFLLENQIPFRVLELLTSLDPSQKKQWHWREIIQKLDKLNTEIKSEKEEKDIGNPVHLLDLLRTYLVPNTSPNSNIKEDPKNSPPSPHIKVEQLPSPNSNTTDDPKNSPPSPRTKVEQLPEDIDTFASIDFDTHVVGAAYVPPSLLDSKNNSSSLLDSKNNSSSHLLSNSKNPPPDHGWHIFRNVKDLKLSGINLQRSGTSLLTDISFTSWYYFAGKLTLPVIIVDDSTRPKFMNLIAYEMCTDYDNDFAVTSYVCFMDSLIDQAEDVRELRKARILLNFLGSDDEVAQLFNEISTDLVPNMNAYMSVKNNIEKHCENKWKTWTAEAYHDHFSSPWTTIAFLGVVVALLLTGIQTWFTVFSPK